MFSQQKRTLRYNVNDRHRYFATCLMSLIFQIDSFVVFCYLSELFSYRDRQLLKVCTYNQFPRAVIILIHLRFRLFSEKRNVLLFAYFLSKFEIFVRLPN